MVHIIFHDKRSALSRLNSASKVCCHHSAAKVSQARKVRAELAAYSWRWVLASEGDMKANVSPAGLARCPWVISAVTEERMVSNSQPRLAHAGFTVIMTTTDRNIR